MLAKDTLEEFKLECELRRLTPRTIKGYYNSTLLFLTWLERQQEIKELETIRPQHIKQYIQYLIRKQLTPSYINSILRCIRAYFRYATEEGYLSSNPTTKIRQLRNERKAQEYLEDHEIEKLLKIFDRSYFPEHRDFMAIMLILDTGMRLGECLRVTTDDIDMDDRTICLPAENTKGRRTRFVFFSVKTAKSLQRWLRYKDRYTNSKLLFPKKCGQPLEIHSFESGFKWYLGRAGIDKVYSPHALRNNFAKRCLMNGMDIYTLSWILGHSSVAVTENAYLDLTDWDLRHRYQNLSPIENMRP